MNTPDPIVTELEKFRALLTDSEKAVFNDIWLGALKRINPNDELLTILRALAFFSQLIIQVPQRMAAEREILIRQLGQVLVEPKKMIEAVAKAFDVRMTEFDKQLGQMERKTTQWTLTASEYVTAYKNALQEDAHTYRMELASYLRQEYEGIRQFRKDLSDRMIVDLKEVAKVRRRYWRWAATSAFFMSLLVVAVSVVLVAVLPYRMMPAIIQVRTSELASMDAQLASRRGQIEAAGKDLAEKTKQVAINEDMLQRQRVRLGPPVDWRWQKIEPLLNSNPEEGLFIRVPVGTRELRAEDHQVWIEIP
jgi:hypothetical protein